MTKVERLLMILIAADVFIFSLVCFGNVKRGECASSAAWDMSVKGKFWGKFWVPVIDKIFFFQADHCKKSWENQPEIYLNTNEQQAEYSRALALAQAEIYGA